MARSSSFILTRPPGRSPGDLSSRESGTSGVGLVRAGQGAGAPLTILGVTVHLAWRERPQPAFLGLAHPDDTR